MKAHHRIFFIQFAVATSLGALISRLPDIQRKFELTEGQLGLLLISLSTGVLVGLTFSVPLIERLGARSSAFVTVLGASLLFASVPWTLSASAAAPVMFAAGILTGAFEVNANIETDRHEAVLGRRIMSRAHGMWSLGFFLTALFGAGMRQAGISMELHNLVVFVVIAIAGSIVFSRISNAPARSTSETDKAPILAFPTRSLLPLCLIGAAPLLAEGAGVDWSAIYMRDVFDVAPFTSGLAVAIFSLFIAIGRLYMDPVVDRYSPRSVATCLLVVVMIGLTLVAAAPHPVAALIGFALMGLGCSSVYPLAISAAAGRSDRSAGINVASLGQTTFLVFFAGPPVLGFVAEHLGIRLSYVAVIPVIIAALFVTKALSNQRVAELLTR
jgi:MFS family permease